MQWWSYARDDWVRFGGENGGVNGRVGVCMLGCRRGAIVTTFIVCYALTSFIAGYVSGGFYSRNDGAYLYPCEEVAVVLGRGWCGMGSNGWSYGWVWTLDACVRLMPGM